MTLLLRKEARFDWKKAQANSFELLKSELLSDRVLAYSDFEKPFILAVDASGTGIGGVLAQTDEQGRERPIGFTSRMLNEAEKNYSTKDRETLAVVWSVEHFRPYLFGRRFTIYTDHQAIPYMNNSKKPGAMQERWQTILAQYDYEMKYRKGKLNSNADALSRNPVDPPNDCVLFTKVSKKPLRKNMIFAETEDPDSKIIHFTEGTVKFEEVREDTVFVTRERYSSETLKEVFEELRNYFIGYEVTRVATDYETLKLLALIQEKDLRRSLIEDLYDPSIHFTLLGKDMKTPETEIEKLEFHLGRNTPRYRKIY